MAGVVVVGAGPGIGLSVARRFAKEGMPVALIARHQTTVDAVATALAPMGVPVLPLTANSTDETALRVALDTATERFGLPDVAVYNAALIQADTVSQLPARAHRDAWEINVLGALAMASHLVPEMARRGSGTFLATGGMPTPHPAYASLSLGKAGLRTLVNLLAMEYEAEGVHVASVTVNGHVGRGTAFDPDDIAEQYWQLHLQPRDAWQRELVFNGSPAHASTAN